MLTYDQIKEYFSHQAMRLNPRGALVEYLQYECLDSLFKQTNSRYLSFIGGTAIRIVYNSQRFSEDLDFDNFGLYFAGFKVLMGKLCRELKVKGLELEHRFVERDAAFHCYIKFLNLLQRYGLTGHKEEKIFLSVDTQKKRKIIKPEIKTLNKFGIFRPILVNSPAILLSQKLITVLQRKRERGRDFYDSSFLSGLAQPDYPYIKEVTGLGKKEFCQKLLQRCYQLNYKSLAEDVSPFLLDPQQRVRILNFPNTIKEILKAN